MDSNNILISVKAKKNLSAKEIDLILKEVKERISGIKISASYAKSGTFLDNVIAEIQLEVIDWCFRYKFRFILNDIRSSIQDIKGAIIDIQEEN
ncbi:MAG: hypothetical protein ACR5KW_01110 [Wolbachia sp.]